MNYETGITLVTGIPGSGKSFTAVENVLDTIRRANRPVYTNLPLKWRVMRLWLNKVETNEISGLIRPLTEATFNRFLERFNSRHKFLDAHPHLRRKSALKLFYDQYGPDHIEGPDLNWIPAGSLIVIDEAHHWYPNPALSNVRKKEPPELMSYLTMHRHLLHQVTFITQAQRQVSTTIKSLLNKQVAVVRCDADIPMLGLRFSRFGFVAFKVDEWEGIADIENDPPERSWYTWPSLPWNSYKFRLYSSFTHMGSLRELKRELSNLKEQSIIQVDDSDQETPNKMKKRYLILLLLFSCFTGMILNQFKSEPPPVPVVQAPEFPSLDVIGFTTDSVLIRDSGKVLNLFVGSIHQGFTLQSFNRRNKTFTGTFQDDVYVYNNGSFTSLGNSLDAVNGLLDSIQ